MLRELTREDVTVDLFGREGIVSDMLLIGGNLGHSDFKSDRSECTNSILLMK